ncbi:MAG: CAP domain-containing protein [Armatimonadota bacterium]
MRRTPWLVGLLGALAAASIAWARGSAVTPQQAARMLAQAEATACAGDLTGAITTALEVCERAPDFAPAHGTAAVLLQRQRDEARARDHYARFQLAGLLACGAADSDLTRQIAQAEGLLVHLCNEERIQRGLSPLRPDLTLAEMARRHSEEMRDLGYFSHSSPVPANATLEARYRNIFRTAPRMLAENVSRMYGTLWSFTPDNIRQSHQRLMSSSGHCRNILWDRVDSIGVGIAVSNRGDYWITQNFALLGVQ